MVKVIKVAFLMLMCYLLQTTVAPLLAIEGVAPNIAIAIFACVSVALGRMYTIYMSAAMGYLMEITLPALNYMNLVLYPVAAFSGALLFSDKSERQLAVMRSANASPDALRQMNPYFRTILAALISSLVFEGIHFAYIMLSGVAPSLYNIGKMAQCVVYTVILATVLQFPLRWYLGMKNIKKANL